MQNSYDLDSSVGCTVPVRVSDYVRCVPSALATIKGLKGLKGPKGISPMTLLLTDSEDSKDFEDSSDFAFAATPSQLIKSLSPVGCTVPVRVSDSVCGVPSALATIKGLKGQKGLKGSTNHQKERPKRAKRPERH